MKGEMGLVLPDFTDFYRERAIKASDLLQKIVLKYCVDWDKEEDYPYGCIPVHTDGSDLMREVLAFLDLEEGDDACKVDPDFFFGE